jgi:M6 family metalloprotease-like protein
MFTSLLSSALLYVVVSDSFASAASCPKGFRWDTIRRRQCLPNRARLLPLRTLTVSPASKLAHVLLDKRVGTYVATSSSRATSLQVNLGRRYTVTKVKITYQNFAAGTFPVMILDETGKSVGSGSFVPSRLDTLEIPLVKVVGSGAYGKRVPVGQTFRVQIPQTVGAAVRVSDVYFVGGSDPSDAPSGGPATLGLAVVVDFPTSQLESYTQDATAIRNVDDLRKKLDQMESHWSWMSWDSHRVEWAIERITMDQDYAPNAYGNNWVTFRDELAAKLLAKVRIADYDSNGDGILDHVWFVLASKNATGGDGFVFSIGGRSMHKGVDMFVDGQGAFAVTDNCIGCFNHKVGHTDAVGRGDIYGDFNNLGSVSIMSYPWGSNPGGFLAVEHMELGWIDVLRISEDATDVCASTMEDASAPFSYRAVLIETGDPDEFFMLEDRKRPASGWGSGWSFDADGILITHILTTGSNSAGPNPYIRIEPADGSLPYGKWPTEADLWQSGDQTFDGTLYDGSAVFAVTNFRREPGATMCFDVRYF